MPRNVKDLKSAWVDPDDAPELTGEVFARAALKEGEAVLRPATGTLTRRGRPRMEHPKRQVTIRLDSDLVDSLRASGPGWQSRINDILRRAVGS
ncbi:BrnA antitoxin family protein [Phenylobacterium montanum]|uniref:BrnA antitoxin family protein n=1 Tax=Phenylobacterium montanum TaxID=2823693 RepID=A0A975IVU3_9CAUL|nr:BrnA antitoxin family protein [Caulobacter sp. S6]QUD89208.1 BrnA antitoxin family protein [Caulobacter sp. S6]